jgi:endonuclease/exonuclease/phosphatase family metal-dependent hydrolase
LAEAAMSQVLAGRFTPRAQPVQRDSLRLLSYNIQAGVDTRFFRHYVTRSWQHLLPYRERLANLNRIALLLADYDLVGLQEVDAGSLRSGFLDQTQYLAVRAGFTHWYKQVNRNLGKLAQHSNGLLSRLRPESITEHKLPGMPGRGAMLCRFGSGESALVVCILHLALGRRARQRQLEYVSELVRPFPHLIVMGDMNCHCQAREMVDFVDTTGLQEPSCDESTFPSWRPMRSIDHILVSPSLRVRDARVVDYPLSDHLPISLEVDLPAGLVIEA